TVAFGMTERGLKPATTCSECTLFPAIDSSVTGHEPYTLRTLQLKAMTFPLIFCRIFGLLGATPVIVFGLLSAGDEVRNFFDPCFFFADTPGGNPLPAGCHTGGGTSETKGGVMLRLILVQGTAVAAGALGLIGAFRFRSRLVLGTSIYLFVLTIPL